MNNYIINPSIFYWMNVLDTVRGITLFCSITSMATLIVLAIAYLICINTEEYTDAKIYKKVLPVAAIIAVISSIIVIFVPDKRTSMEMLIARTATYENAQLTVQGIKEIVDYIVQAINGI